MGHFSWSASGIPFRFAGVSMIEGATAFTRIPSPATSFPSPTLIAATAALLAAYATIPPPCSCSSAGRAATFTIRPPLPAFFIARTASRQHR